MHPCRVPHLEMSPTLFTMANIDSVIPCVRALRSVRHCALVVCDTKWLHVALHGAFWISAEVVQALISCCMTGAILNLLLSRTTFCVQLYNHAPVYCVILFEVCVVIGWALMEVFSITFSVLPFVCLLARWLRFTHELIQKCSHKNKCLYMWYIHV